MVNSQSYSFPDWSQLPSDHLKAILNSHPSITTSCFVPYAYHGDMPRRPICITYLSKFLG